jgi:hypothetical protein
VKKIGLQALPAGDAPRPSLLLPVARALLYKVLPGMVDRLETRLRAAEPAQDSMRSGRPGRAAAPAPAEPQAAAVCSSSWPPSCAWTYLHDVLGTHRLEIPGAAVVAAFGPAPAVQAARVLRLAAGPAPPGSSARGHQLLRFTAAGVMQSVSVFSRGRELAPVLALRRLLHGEGWSHAAEEAAAWAATSALPALAAMLAASPPPPPGGSDALNGRLPETLSQAAVLATELVPPASPASLEQLEAWTAACDAVLRMLPRFHRWPSGQCPATLPPSPACVLLRHGSVFDVCSSGVCSWRGLPVDLLQAAPGCGPAQLLCAVVTPRRAALHAPHPLLPCPPSSAAAFRGCRPCTGPTGRPCTPCLRGWRQRQLSPAVAAGQRQGHRAGGAHNWQAWLATASRCTAGTQPPALSSARCWRASTAGHAR